ncbi:MAG TPA: CRTAC1 family protein [Xenococcaceae cyanobacterium]
MLFQEVISESGISRVGVTYGASWGDFNNDNLPDLWLVNHGNPAELYGNQGNGTFKNVTSEVLVNLAQRDQHGAAWADFDHDGDRDLIQLVGGDSGTGSLTNPQLANQLLVNQQGQLEDLAPLYGLEYIGSRARNPVWFDSNQDGLLDLFVGSGARTDGLVPATIFQQQQPARGISGFEDLGNTLNFDLSSANFGFIADFTADNTFELATIDAVTGLEIYDSRTIEDISDGVIPSGLKGNDFISGDFNGDLLTDLYITRQGLDNSGVALENEQKIRLRLQSQSNLTKGIKFQTSGNLNFDFFTFAFGQDLIAADRIYIGASGFNPDNLAFSLSSNDPKVAGISSYTPGVDEGIYIGYNSNSQEWEVILASANQDLLLGFIDSSTTISEIAAIGFNRDRPPLEDILLINNNGTLEDFSADSGINQARNAGVSAVAGDFDNDMDEDIYVVTANQVINEPNIFYENQGNGTFIAREDSAGAAGATLGIGDSVTTADYNLDGFLDLFLTNGRDLALLNQDAPVQLFQNQGNDNHWLAIDLEGVISNRDGIGAKVYITAGGKTQLREQTGGMHNRAQNHSRLHVGLGQNPIVQELVVEWSSGIVQTIKNLPADQLIQIIEPSESFVPGKPTITPESGVLLWQDTFDGVYHLRTVADKISTEFKIDLIATQSPTSVAPISIEKLGNNIDSLEITDFGFSLTSKLFDGEDGVDFVLPPGTKALISVTQDGIPNPRQLKVGQSGSPLTPDGWIVASDELATRPDYTPGEDLGLFIGEGEQSDPIELRWNGDNKLHNTKVTAIASQETAEFTPVSIEKNDSVTNLENGVEIEGLVSSSWDGLNITATETTDLGFTYEQDNLFQGDRVNPGQNFLAEPNAYLLPLASPYGVPDYDPSSQEGLFLWKEATTWHLRVTGTKTGSRYQGSLISEDAAFSLQKVSLEADDLINNTNPNRIDFDLSVFQGFEDGINFTLPENSSLTLTLENAESAVNLVRIGAEQWNVSALPLDLTGW